ncbi:MAG: choice-of-anchor L domain-containing protein [Bacteroidales bacterium]|nr:choice-of-anchor L domain-containing protein [Bacteroidales bacterium]
MKQLLLLFLIVFTIHGYSQLNINQSFTPQQLVQNTLIGYGVTVSNITYTGDLTAIGKFTNGGTTNLGLLGGIVMTSGSATNAPGPNSSGSITTNNNGGSDPQLANLVSGTVQDASVLEFDFVPIADTLRFRYVFASDEYPEFANSSFNDVFGFFISGPNPAGGNYLNHNMAIIPGTANTPVSINNINNGTSNTGPCMNCTYYYNNLGGLTIEYDGLTTVLTAFALVVPCSTYHFKAAVADVGDGAYDSGVFLEANSFISNAVQISTSFSVAGAYPYGLEGCNNAILKATIPKKLTVPFQVPIDTMWGTAINGTDFTYVPNYITVPAGSKTGSLVVEPLVDYATEGVEDFHFKIQTSVCTIDTIDIEIHDYVPITLNSSSDTLVCSDTASLKVIPTFGLTPYNINWQPSNLVSNPNGTHVSAFPAQTTQFVIEVSDISGCPPVFDTINVTVAQKPSVSFLPDIFNGCEPLTVNFQDMSYPIMAAWNWDLGDGTQLNVQHPTHTYSAGIFDISLSVETVDGCKGSFSVPHLITVYPKPVAFFEPTPPVVTIEDPTINFVDMSTNGMIYSWDFGDPNSVDNFSSLTNPTHTYGMEGNYTVWLFLETDHGCKDSVSRQLMVIVDEIEIPNVITPNGDGANEVFYIKNIDKLEWSRLVIYNRWGKAVYRTEHYKNDWDADNLADGVYYYILEYRTYFREDKAQGTVTVMRHN